MVLHPDDGQPGSDGKKTPAEALKVVDAVAFPKDRVVGKYRVSHRRLQNTPPKSFLSLTLGAQGRDRQQPTAVRRVQTRSFFIEQGGYHSGHVLGVILARDSIYQQWAPCANNTNSLRLCCAEVDFVWTRKQRLLDYKAYSSGFPMYTRPPSLSSLTQPTTVLVTGRGGAEIVVYLSPEAPTKVWKGGTSLDALCVGLVALAAAMGVYDFFRTAKVRMLQGLPARNMPRRPPESYRPKASGSYQAEEWEVLLRHPPCVVYPSVCDTIISCFEDCSAFTFKHRLYHNLATWCKRTGAPGGIERRMPPSHIYNTGESPEALLRFMSSHPQGTLWIAKTTAGANGTDIHVSDSPSEIVAEVTRPQYLAKEYWVVQRVVPSPLIRGRRFSLRLFFVAVGTVCGLDIWVWDEAVVALCLGGPSDPGISSVVSNFKVQKHTTRYREKQHFLSFSEAVLELPQLSQVWERCCRTVVEAFAACLGEPDFRYCPGAFEILGVDFVLQREEDALVPMLLEGNLRPGFATNRAALEGLVENAVLMMLHQRQGDRAAATSGPSTHHDKLTKIASFLHTG
eukprot:Sspe_Gene.62242::Locus_34844_Transcript_1_1_Confidence_1.000_Length_3205::g.62242::m.62242